MADRKPFLLRIDARVLEGVQRWANDDLRSLNAHRLFEAQRRLRAAGMAPGGKLLNSMGSMGLGPRLSGDIILPVGRLHLRPPHPYALVISYSSRN